MNNNTNTYNSTYNNYSYSSYNNNRSSYNYRYNFSYILFENIFTCVHDYIYKTIYTHIYKHLPVLMFSTIITFTALVLQACKSNYIYRIEYSNGQSKLFYSLSDTVNHPSGLKIKSVYRLNIDDIQDDELNPTIHAD